MYNVLFTHQAERDLALFDLSIADRIIDRIECLGLHADSVIHQRLKGEQWGKAYKLRVGSYRVIYQLSKTHNNITVLRIGHRKDIYKDKE